MRGHLSNLTISDTHTELCSGDSIPIIRLYRSNPACCSPLDTHWPFFEEIEFSTSTACRFDSVMFRNEHFEQTQICAPDSVRRSVAKRRAEFLAGRLCARDALGRLTGQWNTPEMNDDGSPHWPAGTAGSITHCASHAMAVVADTRAWRGVGLDMEQWIPDDSSPSMSREIFSRAEHTRFGQSLSGKELTLIFSLKESLFKALYPLVGTRFYFEDAEVLTWNNAGQAKLRLLCNLSTEWCDGTQIAATFRMIEDRLLSLITIPAR